MSILISFYQLATGLGLGLFFGTCGWIFRLLNKTFKYLKFLKGSWVLFVGLAIEVSMTAAKFPQAKFIAAFSFGYFSHLVWHEHKPWTFLMNVYDKFLVAVVFGHVGGSLNLYAINKDVFGIAFGLFILAEFVWFTAMCCTSFLWCYRVKEAIFVGLCWIPKGAITVTTAFSVGPAIETLMEEGDLKDKFWWYSAIMQTCSLLPLLLTTPLGAILANTFVRCLVPKPK